MKGKKDQLSTPLKKVGVGKMLPHNRRSVEFSLIFSVHRQVCGWKSKRNRKTLKSINWIVNEKTC